jgi:ribosomal protein L11 methyltransferase
MPLNLAPRITLYSFGSPAPAADAGWLALAQLPQARGSAVFGDGSHPTTRLCAGALDLLCRQRQPEGVLDVGTGTGVLARIARARGARFVVGTDIDPDALAAAKADAELDDDLTSIHFGSEAPDHWGASFDLVVANILEEPLRQLAAPLSRALKPGGVLLLSGFTRLQVPAMRVHYTRAGFSFASESQTDDWALLRFGLRAHSVPHVIRDIQLGAHRV